MTTRRFGAALALVVLSAASACSSTARLQVPHETRATPIAVTQDASHDFAGKWDTTFGPLTLSRFGERLAGSYGDQPARTSIEGVQRESRFTFKYRERREAGEGWFELADDGASFHGQWREQGDGDWAAWDGTRAGGEPRERTFSGVWRTSYGTLRLEQHGAQIRGTYSDPVGSKLEGTLEGNVLRASYTEPDGTRGRAVFELSDDATRFRGVWSADAQAELDLADEHAAQWTGERAVAVPGRTWLVVLEAPWEESLNEHEYSYGAMLRAFFERVPGIEIRHRIFHGRDDFVRACGELGDLIEPVVLYVSTHGSPKGISAGDDVIDGAAVGEALRGVNDLRLLHLGSCALLAEDFGDKLREAAQPKSFPISGFTVYVDWASSALVDFTYLDLVLEQGLAPAEAVRAARSMLSFAGSEGQPDDPLPATDLKLLGVER